jgi:hypothetical protein
MQCANCGSPITNETRFCAGCGAALPAAHGHAAGRHSAVLADEAQMAALKELHDKKRQIGIEMRAILEFTEQSGASEADRTRYADLREDWAKVDSEITAKMAVLMERQPAERRQRVSRSAERRVQLTEMRRQDRRSGGERRVDDRREGADRRDPFPGDLPTQPMPKIEDPPPESLP